ncbi:GNAT family N-acetyltransferase [Methylobacterium radiodurans]|uniref:Cellulose biosynthesis protein CelD n=1 Tax=Methylobacterium radiodurans TaxID=2202828 RepID=A0A2U8VRA3_9HYPH|nr:GNAT family N-acetyltransferase [Methylobacterium radiodurans]AWN35822.1 cellulose biosynthesis protein CelD [Methylobacterium radiodurans]
MLEALRADAFGVPLRDGARAACSVTVSQDLASLREAWTALEARAGGNVFQSYAWCRTWDEAARRAGCDAVARVVTVRESGRLVLLWPLAIRRLGPLRILRSFGEPATQYADALVAPGGESGLWLAAAWQAVREMRDVDAVFLRGVRGDAVIAPLLASRSRFVTRTAEAPFCDFRNAQARRRSGRTRNTLQRNLRNLAEAGPVRFEVAAGAEERAEAMTEAVRLKQAWLRRTGRFSAGYAHPANAAFLRGLADCPNALVLRLRVGDTTAAVEAGLIHAGAYASLVQAYDARYAAQGPGRLLFRHMVENAAGLGIDQLDFLAPACRHKSEWATGAMPVRDYALPLRLRGWILLGYVRHLRPWAKACRERLGAALTGWGIRPSEREAGRGQTERAGPTEAGPDENVR